jgi:LasA protease
MKARERTNRSIDKRAWMAFTVLAFALLACARANVAPSAAIGSGELPPPTSKPTEVEDTPAPTAPVPTAPPATETPAKPEPIVSPTFPATPTSAAVETEEPQTLVYEAQPGDSLKSVAIRFGVLPEEVASTDVLPAGNSMIDPGQILLIPKRLGETSPVERWIPDSEVVFSPNASSFDIDAFVSSQPGYLKLYRETVYGKWRSGAEVVGLVARNNSVNPRLLLVMLEYQASWLSNPTRPEGDDFQYPMGMIDPQIPGLYRQLTWLANELGNGYYGWRSGTLTELRFEEGKPLRLAPELNAGTVALQYFFSLDQTSSAWRSEWDSKSFLDVFTGYFGDPWAYDYPLFEPGVEQPPLILPFIEGHLWSFTGGPHGAWEHESAWAALDFAPAASVTGCYQSEDWATASAPGIVVRSEDGVVVLDLDGDGREHSGWALLYLHIAEEDRIQEGELVAAGDLIGHPSCEGGIATGTHIHIARKYNGEWILADGPIPFNLEGWVAQAGSNPYQGALVRGDEEVLACTCATRETLITR